MPAPANHPNNCTCTQADLASPSLPASALFPGFQYASQAQALAAVRAQPVTQQPGGSNGGNSPGGGSPAPPPGVAPNGAGSASKDDDSSNSTRTIAIAVGVGVPVGLILIAVIVVLVVRSRRANQVVSSKPDGDHKAQQPVQHAGLLTEDESPRQGKATTYHASTTSQGRQAFPTGVIVEDV